MKKLLTAILAIFFAAALYAQQPAHETVSNNLMRVFVKDGEDVLTNIPSKHLSAPARANIILPAGYGKAGGVYPVVYIISGEVFDKARVEAAFGAQKANSEFIFVSLNMPAGDRAAFLTREFLPYIETNYKADGLPEKRILAAAGADAIDALRLLEAHPEYFLNAALLLPDTTPLPALRQFDGRVKIYAAGRAGNIARLQRALEGAGLKFGQNFVSKIYLQSDSAPQRQRLDLRYFVNPADFAVKSVAAYLSAPQVPAAEDAALELWLLVKSKAGMLNYIPAELKIAPPFLNWDAEAAQLSVIDGAAPGKVKISAPLYFYGKGFQTTVKIAD